MGSFKRFVDEGTRTVADRGQGCSSCEGIVALVFQGLREFPEARAALEGVLKGYVEQWKEGDDDAE